MPNRRQSARMFAFSLVPSKTNSCRASTVVLAVHGMFTSFGRGPCKRGRIPCYLKIIPCYRKTYAGLSRDFEGAAPEGAARTVKVHSAKEENVARHPKDIQAETLAEGEGLGTDAQLPNAGQQPIIAIAVSGWALHAPNGASAGEWRALI